MWTIGLELKKEPIKPIQNTYMYLLLKGVHKKIYLKKIILMKKNPTFWQDHFSWFIARHDKNSARKKTLDSGKETTFFHSELSSISSDIVKKKRKEKKTITMLYKTVIF